MKNTTLMIAVSWNLFSLSAFAEPSNIICITKDVVDAGYTVTISRTSHGKYKGTVDQVRIYGGEPLYKDVPLQKKVKLDHGRCHLVFARDLKKDPDHFEFEINMDKQSAQLTLEQKDIKLPEEMRHMTCKIPVDFAKHACP